MVSSFYPFEAIFTPDYFNQIFDLTFTTECDIITPVIKTVKFSPPATIVFWEDGTKTVVKAQNGEPFDKEKGLAMAFIKKCYGNKGCYNEIFKKWCNDDEEDNSHKSNTSRNSNRRNKRCESNGTAYDYRNDPYYHPYEANPKPKPKYRFDT